MRFSSVKIRNYRQYREVDIEFAKTTNYDMHAIIATNGAGKTNLLNAVNWCLYGDEPHLQNKNEALTICNLDAIADAEEMGEENCVVTVTINAEHGDKEYVFERTQTVRVKSKFPTSAPTLTVKYYDDDGNLLIVEGDEANEIVESHVPRRIREYFFFDGEQLSNYFRDTGESKHIKDSIHEIAQVNILTAAKNHLESIRKAYEKQCGSNAPEIQSINETIADLERQIEDIKNEIEELEKQVKISEEEEKRADSLISGDEAVVDDNNRYNSNLQKLAELEESKKKLFDKLKEFVRKYTILLYLYEINTRTHEFITKRYDAGQLPPQIDKALILKSLSDHACAICHHETDEQAEEHLKQLLKKLEVSVGVSQTLVGIKNDISSALAEARKYLEQKGELLDRLAAIEDQIDDLTEENERLSKSISKVSAIEEIEELIAEREQHRELIKKNIRKIGNNETRLEKAQSDLAKQQDKLQQALSKEEKSTFASRCATRSRELEDIVGSVEKEIMQNVRERMEAETMAKFSQLLQTENEYRSVQLDSEYRLKLIHNNGDSCLGSASAGHVELLALAFTLALHTVSENEAMLFIDSPVGRISDLNRKSFAEVLMEVSREKQLILTFTLSEFSEEISSVFKEDLISSTTRLADKKAKSGVKNHG